MRHVFFALFEDAGEADAAATELGVIDATGEKCHVEVHRGPIDSESLPIGETKGQTRLAQGALMGGVLGAAVGGLLLGPAHILLVDSSMAAVVCGGLGAVLGGLGGLLTGVGAPDSKLEGMSEAMRRGGVVLAVDAEGREDRDRAEEIVRRHGALVQHHALI